MADVQEFDFDDSAVHIKHEAGQAYLAIRAEVNTKHLESELKNQRIAPSSRGAWMRAQILGLLQGKLNAHLPNVEKTDEEIDEEVENAKILLDEQAAERKANKPKVTGSF